MKADNQSLTEEDRETLKKFAFDIIIKPAQTDYVAALVATANAENLENVIQGFQSFPRPNIVGFGTSMWNINGSIHSPGFGGSFDGSFYERNQRHKYALEFPDNLAEQVGNDSMLAIELEVDTREEEGWIEEVLLPMLPIPRDGLPTKLKTNNDCLRTENQLTASKVEAGNV